MHNELILHYKEKKMDAYCRRLQYEIDRDKQLLIADRINRTQIEIECILCKLKDH